MHEDSPSAHNLFLERERARNEIIEKDIFESFESYVKLFDLTEADFHKSILDVGTGGGAFPLYLREKYNNQRAFGIDTQAAVKNIKKLEFYKQGSINNIPFPDNSFELVLAKNVVPMFLGGGKDKTFPHTHYGEDIDFRNIIAELLRVCKPEGTVMFDFSNEANERINQKDVEKAMEAHDNLKHMMDQVRDQSEARIVFLKQATDYLKNLKDCEVTIDESNKKVIVKIKKEQG